MAPLEGKAKAALLFIALTSGFVMLRSLPPSPEPKSGAATSLFPPRQEQPPIHEQADAPLPLPDGPLGRHAPADAGSAPLPYRLEAPDRTWRLGDELEEISDISYAVDGGSVWAVNDEEGTLYRLGLEDAEILDRIPFGPPGDYEAVQTLGAQVVVGRSDGVLFFVDPASGQRTSVDTHLGPGCNLEGLDHDPQGRLYLACKAELPSRPRRQKAYAIYAFDVATQVTQREPVLVIDTRAIDDFLDTQRGERVSGRTTDFAPSGLALHPTTGALWVVSARDSLLVVLNAKGSVLQAQALDPHLHPQPEGITFAPDGTLFISNEARGDQPLLHRYAPSRDEE